MTGETNGGDSGYTSVDFEQYPVEVEVHLPPEAWNEACKRYHAARKKGDDPRLMDYVNELIDLKYNWNVITEQPNEGLQPIDSEQWEEAGRSLFDWVNAQVRTDIVTALDQLAWKVDHGESISKSDVDHLRQALQNAEFLAQQVATICTVTEPHPDSTEVLGGEGVREHACRIEKDDGE